MSRQFCDDPDDDLGLSEDIDDFEEDETEETTEDEDEEGEDLVNS